MNRKTKRIFCIALALIMLLALAACKKDTPEETPPAPSSSAPAQSTTPDAPPSATPDAPPAQPSAEPQTLVVGYSYFSQKFSPFFSKTAYDRDATDMTQVMLLENDRAGSLILNGIEGETINYNGTDYFYDGIASFEIVQKPDGTVDYNVRIRDDIVFSDGVPLTIDDVIFDIYVMCDPSYDGSYTFYSTPIIGMNNFRTGLSDELYDKYETLAFEIADAGMDNDDFSDWSEDLQNTFWYDYFIPYGEAFAQEIVDYCQAYTGPYEEYYDEVNRDDVAFGMMMWGFGDPDEDGIFVTAVTETEFDVFNGEGPTVTDYLFELAIAYDWDLFDLEDVETAGSLSFTDMFTAFIRDQGLNDPAAGGEIMNIAGVKRTGDYSMTVTTEYFDATMIYNFGFEVAPLHYYGDVNQYNYNSNQFGFPKGDLSIVREKTTEPLGAGPYKFMSYENGVISYEANELFWKGEPKIKYIRFAECTDEDKLAGVVAGTFDVTDPQFHKQNIESIKSYNSNGELSGDVIVTSTVDILLYGYMGIAANNVNVGGDIGSQESKYLRIGLATLLAVHRNTVVNSYYGDVASVIQYPISNASWAAPRPNDEGYRQAYSVDVDGNNIYNDSMNEGQRYFAALEATIGYLKAAGYTWDDASGTFTAAPEGARLIYEVIIPADGIGDHPAYGILTAAKEQFATIGITLEINDPTDSNVLWRAIESGQADMWCAAWQAALDPDMYQVYHSSNAVGLGGTDSNSYFIMDDELDELIVEARSSADQSYRKAVYKRCLEIIMEWGVEVPNYQRKNAIIFSPDRVNMATVTPDITTFWGWMHDLELLEMN